MPGSDLVLSRRLARQARVSERAQQRAARAHAHAVARRDRVLRRARRALPRNLVLAGGGVAAVAVTEQSLLWGLVAYGGVRAAVAARRLIRPPTVPPVPQPPAAAPPPPHPRSAAFPAVRRLERVHDSLRRLVPLVAPAGREAATEAWQAAAEADLALRWSAARLAAAEPHRGADPELLDSLYRGVAAQEELVAGVADLVAASADPVGGGRLRDVTDRLHGMAQGLREVRAAQQPDHR